MALEREVDGDLFLQDIGQGFGFRPGSFEGAIRYVFEIYVSSYSAYEKSVTAYLSFNGS